MLMDWIDARPIFMVQSDSAGLGEKGAEPTAGVVPLWNETSDNLGTCWNTVGMERGMLDCDYKARVSSVVVVTGFVASTRSMECPLH